MENLPTGTHTRADVELTQRIQFRNLFRSASGREKFAHNLVTLKMYPSYLVGESRKGSHTSKVIVFKLLEAKPREQRAHIDVIE